MTFGPSYDPKVDGERLTTQMGRIRDLMLEASAQGRWQTLEEVERALEARFQCRFPQASISAQLRHLRKPAFGSFVLDKRHRGDPGLGLYEYLLEAPKQLAISDYNARTRKLEAETIPLFTETRA